MRQVDLAEAAGMSWRHLIRMEQGRGGEPKLETLERIAAALDVDIDEITGGDAPFPAEAA
jgi:transcriptional regulator with XRE-family HTH domain